MAASFTSSARTLQPKRSRVTAKCLPGSSQKIAANAPIGSGVTVSAIIAKQIRHMITRGALSPGVHLGQAQLATWFDTSRVQVREALSELAAEGLVLHEEARGFFVATVSAGEARQLYQMRYLFEDELLTTVRWPRRAEVARLTAIIAYMERLLQQGDRATWNAKQREFHEIIFDLSPHKILVQEVLRLWALTERYQSLLPPSALKENGCTGTERERALVRALVHKDREELLRTFGEGRARTETLLLRILEDLRL